MVLAFHGAVNVRPRLRDFLGFGGRGTTVHGILCAARASGFDADAFTISVRQLQELPLPAILHWRRGHYVVLERVSHRNFSIVDPAVGRRSIREAELLREFSGIVIAVEPMDSTWLIPDQSQATETSFHIPIRRWDWLWIGTIPIPAILAMVIAAPHVANLAQSGVGGTTGLVSVGLVLGCAVVILLSEAGLSALDRRVTAQTGAAVAQYFVEGIENAPPAYIVSRTPHFLEHAARDVEPLFNPQFPRPSGLARAVAALALLAVVAMSSVPVAATLLPLGVARVFSRALRRAIGFGEKPWRGQLALRERLRAMLVRPDDLLAVGGLGYAMRQWLAARQRVAAARDQRSPALLLPHGIDLAAALGVTFLVVLINYRATHLSFGDTVEVQLLATAAVAMWWSAAIEYDRLLAWKDNVAILRDTRRERSKIEPTEESAAVSSSSPAPLFECRGVSWAGQMDDPPLLRDVELAVRAGESVAIVGESGSGKTLLAQIILGLRNPSRGRVLVSGNELRELSGTVRGGLVAGVLDDAIPMDGTIGEFLRSTRPASEQDLRRVCALVGLSEWIARLPLAFNTPISRGGAGFASYERRLLTLARVLLLRPTVMVLDATLDALDLRRAYAISEAIARYADTIILLTARPEIVPSCYRHQYLVEGHLRDERDCGRLIAESST